MPSRPHADHSSRSRSLRRGQRRDAEGLARSGTNPVSDIVERRLKALRAERRAFGSFVFTKQASTKKGKGQLVADRHAGEGPDRHRGARRDAGSAAQGRALDRAADQRLCATQEAAEVEGHAVGTSSPASRGSWSGLSTPLEETAGVRSLRVEETNSLSESIG